MRERENRWRTHGRERRERNQRKKKKKEMVKLEALISLTLP